MKKFIKLTSLLLAAMLLFCSCAGEMRERPVSSKSGSASVPGSGAEPPKPGGSAAGFRYGRGFLSQEGQKAYDGLYALAAEWRAGDRVPLPQGYTREETEILLQYFLDDNPELYWLVPYCITDTATGLRSAAFEFYGSMDREAVQAQRREIDTAAERLLEGVAGTAAEMVTELHDRLARHIVYDTQAPAPDIGNIYGGLAGGAGVCDAYAKSFQYLAGKLGIPCIYVRGMTNRGVTHAWNAVELEGSWYYLDVTWDDKEQLGHGYLNITGAEMAREHHWDTAQYPRLPETTGERMDYYFLGGYTVEPGPADTVADALAGAFARRLLACPPEKDGIVFLEVKVPGDTGEYELARDVFFANIFDVLDGMDRILKEEKAGFRIAEQNTVACNYMDAMGILTFFPEIELAASR